MYDSGFFERVSNWKPQRLLLSYDTLAGIIAFFAVHIYSGGGISEAAAVEILTTFSIVSATLFAIVLTGMTIITSFTDRHFLYAWHEIGEFENIVTTFQYNLGLPVVVILFSLMIQIEYHIFAMTFLIALFVYMLVSLLDLVGLVSKYALQRGEFVRQQVESSTKNSGAPESMEDLSNSELIRIRSQLEEAKEEQ